MVLYAVMYTVNADWTGALYGDGKVTLVGLTEEQILASPRVKNWINHKGFGPSGELPKDETQEPLSATELSDMISGLLAQDPNDIMGILSKPMGKWLKYNHPEFMDKPSGEL